MSATRHLNELSVQEKQNLIKSIYANKSYFQNLFLTDVMEMDCTHFAVQFRQAISDTLINKGLISSAHPLESLHETLSKALKTYNFNDGVNHISTYFYDMDETFQTLYYDFIRYLREHFLNEPFWFQATPTIRIHCPNGVNNHHYPRFHSDISYGHPPEEMNIWMPFTHPLVEHGFRYIPLADSKSLIEWYQYDFASFIEDAIHQPHLKLQCERLSVPVTTPFGHFFAFDSRCLHSGMPLFAHTRVSMDIRIYPVSLYRKRLLDYQGSGRRKILFAPGFCYDAKDSDSL